MGSLSGAIYAEGIAEGIAEGVAECLGIYMREEGATLDEALDFFGIDGELRSAVIARIDEGDDATVS